MIFKKSNTKSAISTVFFFWPAYVWLHDLQDVVKVWGFVPRYVEYGTETDYWRSRNPRLQRFYSRTILCALLFSTKQAAQEYADKLSKKD